MGKAEKWGIGNNTTCTALRAEKDLLGLSSSNFDTAQPRQCSQTYPKGDRRQLKCDRRQLKQRGDEGEARGDQKG